MRKTRSGNSWITSTVQIKNLKRILTSTDLATVLVLRQIPHTYQHLYDAFSQQPSYHQECMDVDDRSTPL